MSCTDSIDVCPGSHRKVLHDVSHVGLLLGDQGHELVYFPFAE
jgi:hypothetical protein